MIKKLTAATFITIIISFLSCSKTDDSRNNTINREGKYIGQVTLNGNPYNMVVDLSKRSTSNEYNFLFANRQSVAVVNGNDFTIPLVQGAPSYMVSGNGSFLDSGKMYIF